MNIKVGQLYLYSSMQIEYILKLNSNIIVYSYYNIDDRYVYSFSMPISNYIKCSENFQLLTDIFVE